ncbi:MAG TPA: C-GCAxxG-C-C family protein [Clostridia bacterium]|nr:C-GCAxxG-C-C family protein [Clostridia bacterium]
MDRKQKAYDLFLEGYNCSQSVVGAFDDVLKLDKEYLLNIAIAFGGGFARTRNICGAVAGMGIVVGLLRAKEKCDATDKAEVYQDVQKMMEEFKERNTFENCGDLLKEIDNITDGYVPQVRDDRYYATRPCTKFVLDAVEILDKYIASNK